uniref:Phospholipase A2-like central domain-containing protein n=1 Tax=Apteryx owenii TaxID=8824 RepID=A0A8B9PFV2_APTOW
MGPAWLELGQRGDASRLPPAPPGRLLGAGSPLVPPAAPVAPGAFAAGEHRDTDRCCRDHDHCQHVIHPFTARYGYRNLRWHTISHCDCDRRLRDCLRRVNDTASRAVGQAFFNVLRVPCFEFAYKEECVEPYLYVWCKAYNTVAVAVPREPVLYEFGGELIDRAAGPGDAGGGPRSSTGAGPAPAEHHTTARAVTATTVDDRLLPTPQATPNERKGKEKKKKKGKGLKKKGPSENGRLSHPAPVAHAHPPEQPGAAELGEAARQDLWAELLARSLDLGGEEEASNAVLSDAPAGEGLGKEPAPALPSTAPAAGRKRRRKERNRKKRLKNKAEPEPT